MRDKKKPGTTVIFVRHGAPDFAHDRLYNDAKEDPGLTDLGRVQAANAASLVIKESPAVLISSPMARTVQTAEAITKITGLECLTDERLKERPFGQWDGFQFDSIQKNYPEQFKQWKTDPVGFVPEGGEPMVDHQKRIVDAVEDIIKAHEFKIIVIVAHVGPIRVAIADAINLPLSSYRMLNIDYASLSKMQYGSRQNNLLYLNRE